jgi:hypothetical protein
VPRAHHHFIFGVWTASWTPLEVAGEHLDTTETQQVCLKAGTSLGIVVT